MTDIKQKILIQNKLGLHARASSKLVAISGDYSSVDVTLQKGDEKINGKSIIAVMGLAVTYGTEIEIHCIGKDAESCLKALCELINNKFGED